MKELSDMDEIYSTINILYQYEHVNNTPVEN